MDIIQTRMCVYYFEYTNVSGLLRVRAVSGAPLSSPKTHEPYVTSITSGEQRHKQKPLHDIFLCLRSCDLLSRRPQKRSNLAATSVED